VKAEANPNLIVYFDGKYVPLGEARIGILTHALHYGTGVFEGVRAYWNESAQELYMMRPQEHFERWKQNCRILRIEVPLSSDELCAVTAELMRRNNFRTDVYVRPLAYKSAERVGVSTDDQDAFFLVALPFGEYLHDEKGLHAGVSAWRRVEDNAIPARGKITGAYANSALASDDARRAGYDEAILLNESGHVAEGSTCNLFMIRNGILITPPLMDNVLEGITRASVMELARDVLGLPVMERTIDRSELYLADEIFLTGTAVGVAAVTRVDHREVKDGRIGAWTAMMRKLYFDVARGKQPAYRRWLLPVYEARPEMALKAVGLAETSVA
jgi:branched-chain amino acid aminotransferase